MLHRLAGIVAVSIALAAFTLMVGGQQGTQSAHAADDPLAAVQRLIDAVNHADGAAAAASFTDDGWFQSIDGGSFGLFGQAALNFGFSDFSQEGTNVTLVSSQVSGNTVTGITNATDNDSRAAGVTRYVQPFTAVVRDGKIASLDLRYDQTDSQTQTYLQYEASQQMNNEPPPADAVTLDMGGNQSGQGFLGTQSDGVTVVFFQIAAGPAGTLQPAYIYHGTCSSLGGVAQRLALVEDGSSGSFISMRLDDLTSGQFALTVSASQDDPSVIVSCANIVRSAATTTTTGGTQLPNTGSGGDRGSNGYLWLLAALAAVGATGVAGSLSLRRVRR